MPTGPIASRPTAAAPTSAPSFPAPAETAAAASNVTAPTIPPAQGVRERTKGPMLTEGVPHTTFKCDIVNTYS
ncbi:hypothetical protein AAZX31_20G197700 [Glycine max]